MAKLAKLTKFDCLRPYRCFFLKLANLVMLANDRGMPDLKRPPARTRTVQNRLCGVVICFETPSAVRRGLNAMGTIPATHSESCDALRAVAKVASTAPGVMSSRPRESFGWDPGDHQRFLFVSITPIDAVS